MMMVMVMVTGVFPDTVSDDDGGDSDGNGGDVVHIFKNKHF